MSTYWHRVQHTAQWFYDIVQIQQYHLNFQGLFLSSDGFHVVVEGYNESTLASDGQTLAAWVEEHRPVTLRFMLADVAPPHGQVLDERSPFQRALNFGAPRNRSQVVAELGLRAGPAFPTFAVDFPGADLRFTSQHPLSPAQQSVLQAHLADLGSGVQDTTFDVAAEVKGEEDSLAYVWPPAMALRARQPQAVVERYEEDEAFWLGQRAALLTESQRDLRFERPVASRCYVDGVFGAHNIRSYLTLYDRVIIQAPVEQGAQRLYADLHLSEHEVFDLARQGRLQFALTQRPDRYDRRFLAQVAEIDGAGLYPRRLLAATISDARARNPLFYPAFSVRERQGLLRLLQQQAEQGAGLEQRFHAALTSAVAAHWARFENTLDVPPVFEAGASGLGRMARDVVLATHGLDLGLELATVAPSVQIAGALGATVISSETPEFSLGAHAALVASLYTGVPLRPRQATDFGATQDLVHRLLAVRSDEPIADFLAAFGEGDLARLRRRLFEVLRQAGSPEELRDHAEALNQAVQRYERRTERLDVFNLVGCADAAYSVASSQLNLPGMSPYVTVGVLVWGILNKALHGKKAADPVLGAVFDAINALQRFSPPDAVLVSRMRGRLERARR